MSIKSKVFECQPKCEMLYPERITFGCPKCIKKREMILTETERLKVLKALGWK